MKANQWLTLLAAHPELISIPTPLRQHAVEQHVPVGALIAGLGTQPQFMYLVQKGEVRLRRISMSGTEIVLQRARSGFIAEASLESLAYHCDIVAAERSHLLAFPIPLFRTQLSENESFARFWMISLAREVRSLRAQNERLALRTARERIEHYIESEGRSGQLELRQTRKALALELGLTHEALYRALAAMVASGALAMTRADDRLVLVLKSA